MNIVLLSGQLPRDPELRYSTEGVAYVKFSLAITTWSSKRAKSRTHKTYLDLVAFGTTAEQVAGICRQGDTVVIQGAIKRDSYEQEGQRRVVYGIVVDRLHFVQHARTEGAGAPATEEETDGEHPEEHAAGAAD